MAVPYTFGSATTSIPLSQLDSNFATTITLGNTAIQLGNTVTTLNNMTLANVTISSGTSNVSSTSIANGTSNVTIASSGGAIAMATNGTTAITVDTSQNVGIGTTTPTDSDGFGRFIDLNGTNGAAIYTRTNGSATQWTELGNYGADGYLKNRGAGSLIFNNNAAERMRLNSTGALVLAGGSTSANGIGITFPATQSASSNANTLDDYEEGTWTPAQGSGLTVVGTFASVGRYTKIGRFVFVSGQLSGSTSISSTSGTQMFTGLPFTVLENGATSTFTNGAINIIGGLGAFFTQAYSATTVGATNAFDFTLSYTV
jgi:hypothetical protein